MEYYIPISRRLFEHPFWCEERTFSRFEAWLDIVQSARFEDTKQLIGNRFIEVKRGQMLVSLRFLGSRWQWSTKKVNTFLDLLIQDKMIIKETPKETGQTVITICNYDKYNFQLLNEETKKKQQRNSKETVRKHQGNKVNKENKEKELEEGKETSTSVEAKKGELSLSQTGKIDWIGLMNYFNSTFKDKLPVIKSIDDKRKKAIKARISQYSKQAVFDVFQLVLKSDFLLGNNNNNWKCDFDWIFKPTNFTKILEGNYNGTRLNKNQQDSEQRKRDSILTVATTVREAAAKKRKELEAEGVIE